MCEDGHDTDNTQTQTQNSQVEWSQSNTPSFIPNIWGRLYYSKPAQIGRRCWLDHNNTPEYYDLISNEFTLGRACASTIVIKRDNVGNELLSVISKNHFVIKRDLSEALSPAILTDLSHNGTFVNDLKIGKGNSRVLDDNDVISVAFYKMFVYKDLLKNDQDKVSKEISQKYYISKTLGQGACGIVKLAYNKSTCTKYAMKIIRKCRLTNGKVHKLNNPANIKNEIKILTALNHPCIISTEDVVDSPDTVYIVLELMQGGELFDRITKQGNLPEHRTRFLFRQMVLAVEYLHSQGITHRDLKPENVLLESKDEETRVKITDFGLSKFVGEDSFMKTMCGTPNYLAPEVLRANGSGRYGPQVDVWSLGVIFFICLVGYMPFSSDYGTPTVEQILNGQYRYSYTHWRPISAQAKLLMRAMLTVNVKKRITLQQILNHPWMQDKDVIMKVDVLLCCNLNDIDLNKENFDKENNNKNSKDKVVLLAAANKRALSDSFNSSEPIPKKFRVAGHPSIDDTGSTNSYSSEE